MWIWNEKSHFYTFLSCNEIQRATIKCTVTSVSFEIEIAMWSCFGYCDGVRACSCCPVLLPSSRIEQGPNGHLVAMLKRPKALENSVMTEMTSRKSASNLYLFLITCFVREKMYCYSRLKNSNLTRQSNETRTGVKSMKWNWVNKWM